MTKDKPIRLSMFFESKLFWKLSPVIAAVIVLLVTLLIFSITGPVEDVITGPVEKYYLSSPSLIALDVIALLVMLLIGIFNIVGIKKTKRYWKLIPIASLLFTLYFSQLFILPVLSYTIPGF